jgi:hypothetical protein
VRNSQTSPSPQHIGLLAAIHGVPERDRSGDEREPTCAILLRRGRAIAQSAKAVESIEPIRESHSPESHAGTSSETKGRSRPTADSACPSYVRPTRRPVARPPVELGEGPRQGFRSRIDEALRGDSALRKQPRWSRQSPASARSDRRMSARRVAELKPALRRPPRGANRTSDQRRSIVAGVIANTVARTAASIAGSHAAPEPGGGLIGYQSG